MRRWNRPTFGSFRRKARTGVPADHFPPAQQLFESRYGDGVSALVAEGPADDQDDSPAAVAQALDAVIDAIEEARQGDGSNVGQLDDLIAAADVLADKLIAMLGGVDADEPDDGSASALAVLGRLAVARRPVAAVDDVVTDSTLNGKNGKNGIVADADGQSLGHDSMTGAHSHEHSHGDGTTHTHGHFHAGGAVHNHRHSAAAKLSSLTEEERRKIDGENEITDPEKLSAMVASAYDALGGEDAWTKLRTSKGLSASTNADGTVEPGDWHAYLTWEGIRTDEGREFVLGCFQYLDCPLSMRLLVEDDGGHWGAVTCGRIDSITPQDFADGKLRAHYSEGIFGSDVNGQLGELMVGEQTQRFVSVDMRAILARFVEIVVNVDGGEGWEEGEGDRWLQYLSATIGAATIVPMPAMPMAVVAPKSMALPGAPLAFASLPPTLDSFVPEDEDDGEQSGLAAAGASAAEGPSVSYFADPGFYEGDPRLVLQSDDESYACPVDVGDPDDHGWRQVWGHVAWWNCDHTGFPGRHVKPPRSESGYAYYLTGQGVACRDGFVAGVGQVTMGCGHAPMTKQVSGRPVPLSAQEAIAHYDGGYGAVQVAYVRAGEDEFGPWIAGAVRSEVTDEQLRDFMALSLSGDWREIGGRLEMVAVLAVPVPGFPVRRELTAAGVVIALPSDTQAGYTDDRMYALCAAGIVRRVDPVARIAHLERLVSSLSSRVEGHEGALRAEATRRARQRVNGAPSSLLPVS